MTKDEAIKFLKQLYPNGGHCWLDEQRIEAITIAVDAISRESREEDMKQKIKEIYYDTDRSMRGKYCTLLSQTRPDTRMQSRTEIWMSTFLLNKLLEMFPDVIGEIKWARKLNWHFPKDDNEQIRKDMDELGIVLV